MTKLKLEPLEDDKPVKLTIELPAAVFRDLRSYAEILTHSVGLMTRTEPKLIAPMIERRTATDRAFAKARRNATQLAPRYSVHDAGQETDAAMDCR
ncbi:hypothetical protein ABIF38_000115 [Bradyrhizobium japonicum]|uniref:DUF2274 domain-containing protein n=1 Tax=Bradyrhizobium elkanii TaxID=29448 RepID=UPI0003660C99|nr:DUF2274 domain-containing protein [Bradyrhizobium elkanii]MBP2435409.1 hypothetical protein [Bradyrhizobium elkanii]MCP1737822.1 hypothetical protein [Bradyrhizobium elkanii]MCS3575982.1 hypothetical protein [Bradyrhizobium elkanii]MCS3594681.1 hypothetical protein [Bradyrhizobium elkanii]MCS3625875.1 hypothetical protein [Bradyrhizobium elkanii]